jgi:hypothetical protein
MNSFISFTILMVILLFTSLFISHFFIYLKTKVNKKLITYFFAPVFALCVYLLILDFYLYQNIILNKFSYFYLLGASYVYVYLSKDFDEDLQKEEVDGVFQLAFLTSLSFIFWPVMLIVNSSESIENSVKEKKLNEISKIEGINNLHDKSVISSLKSEIEELKEKVNSLIDNDEKRNHLFELIQENSKEKIKLEFKDSNNIGIEKDIAFG